MQIQREQRPVGAVHAIAFGAGVAGLESWRAHLLCGIGFREVLTHLGGFTGESKANKANALTHTHQTTSQGVEGRGWSRQKTFINH